MYAVMLELGLNRIAAVIGSAVAPTLVANAFFVPRYLLPKAESASPAGTLPQTVALGEPEGR